MKTRSSINIGIADKNSFYYANKDMSFSIALIPVADSVTENEILANTFCLIFSLRKDLNKMQQLSGYDY
jgi:hypothetical protein